MSEYGTTIAEKRSVGVKICHGLLEKIKYDLAVARTDNAVEPMRFMINTDYSQDLPISTMGRRIRTRLYFTSESHLHTVLNVLRFANGGTDGRPILSKAGTDIVNSTPELCYLTHIIMRVFDDSRPEMQKDHKRFRVEILFSPGATATPLHQKHDTDTSRFNTAPLQVIGRCDLSCEELESFFGTAIIAGRSEDDDHFEADSMSTMPADRQQYRMPMKDWKVDRRDSPNSPIAHGQDNDISTLPCVREVSVDDLTTREAEEDSPQQPILSPHESQVEGGVPDHDAIASNRPGIRTAASIPLDNVTCEGVEVEDKENGNRKHDKDDSDESILDDDDDSWDAAVANDDLMKRRVLARKRFWSTVAIGSFALGATCLLFALRLSVDTRHRRWSSYRRYNSNR